jgi:hypothetical protein
LLDVLAQLLADRGELLPVLPELLIVLPGRLAQLAKPARDQLRGRAQR